MKFDKDKLYSLREVVGEYMLTLGYKYPNVVVVNADLMGTSRNKKFVEAFPARSFNVGIAEQNLISFSAGLAHEGFIPYANSMAPFISMRACEQCRTDVAYGNLNVRLMGTYAGYSGGISGATHWALEDCAIMLGINGITVIELSDPYQAEQILELSVGYKGPIYIRTGVGFVKPIYNENQNFKIGQAITAKEGNDGCFICSGITVSFAYEASKIIKLKYNKNIRVVDMFTIKPIDSAAIISAAKTGCIVVAQDHNKTGGLGQMVATVLAENGISTKFKILGCNDKYETMAHAEYLYHKNGYDVDGLVTAMMSFLA